MSFQFFPVFYLQTPYFPKFPYFAQKFFVQQASTFTVYSASAGSGKTFTLVKEYLKILLSASNPDYFRHILAVTFTNKAANEMKERVIKNLKAFSGPGEEERSPMFIQVRHELNLPEKLLQQRASNILQAVLDNYSAFNITTIDSFTHRLIRSFAFDLGLTGNFEVEMDATTLLNEAVDALVAKVGDDPELTKVLVDFSLQKADDDKSWDITRELRDIAQLLLNDNDAVHLEKIQNKPLHDFIKLKGELFKQQKTIENNLAEIGKKGMQLIDEQAIEYSDFYYSQFPKHFQNLIASPESVSFDPEKGLAKSIASGIFYTKGKPEHVKSAIDSISKDIIALYSESEALFASYSLNKLFLTSLFPLAVLSSINQFLKELKEEKNVRLHAEFNQLISKNLQQQPAAFIYERLGERFKHFFIDEMQDTSLLQWQNLIPLIHNALSGERSGLQLVGDTKQAIYRWRGSLPEQFLYLSAEGESKTYNPFFIEKKLKGLDTNYRSFDQVVEFNNSFFGYVSQFLNNDFYRHLYAHESVQKANPQKGGYVNISFVDGSLKKEDKDPEYANRVLMIIQGLKEDFELEEICVLTRTRSQGVLIADHLTANGIDIISSETLLLKNSSKVRFIVSLLRYLQNRQDKEALFDAGYFIHDYFKLDIDRHIFLKGLLASENIDGYLQMHGIEFDEAAFVKVSLYEGIEFIVRSFNLNIEADAYLVFFLDEVFQFTSRHANDPGFFLEYWDEKQDKLSLVVPEGSKAVQVMTIHKAKGLEFPVVIFPFDLNIYFDRNTQVWYPVGDLSQYEGFETMLVNCNKSLQAIGETGNLLYQNHRDELELDNYNLLYVAFTRAVEQLYLVGETKKSDGSGTSSALLVDYLQTVGKWQDNVTQYTFGNPDRISIKKEDTKTGMPLGQLISTSWQANNIYIVPDSSLLWDTEAEASRNYGNLVHGILSLVKSPDDVDVAIEKFVRNGTLDSAQAATIKKVVLSVVEHPQLAPYYSHGLEVFNEREFLTGANDIVIPDRVILTEGYKAVIIDYKTGKPEKVYHQQIQNYAVLLESLGIEVEKKMLVYISDKVQVEEV